MKIDLSKIKKAYFIGIKGSGMTAVAQILKAKGIKVVGSDLKEKFFTDEILKRFKIPFFGNFNNQNIPNEIDLVIYSTSYNVNNNLEMVEAKKRNLPMMSYPEVLAELFNQKFGIAISGTHGKTTTTAMLVEAMQEAGACPSAVVGGQMINEKSNALTGDGKYFIAEADEYQNKLKFYNPRVAVLTSVDWDHPDFFPSFTQYKKAFKNFIERIPKRGFLVVRGDSAETLEIAQSAKCRVITYGFSPHCDYVILNLKKQIDYQKNKRPILTQKFSVFKKEESLGEFKIGLISRYNVLNTTAVIAVYNELKLDLKKIKKSLQNFKGTKRRFEYKGQLKGAFIYDDYAHHPKEIEATLQGVKAIYSQRNIWVIFQPHTFTRTEALLSEFSQSFSEADKIIILDIYASARETKGKIQASDLVNLINKNKNKKAKYISTIDEAVQWLKTRIGINDVIITMGAGNVWEVAEKLARG